MDIQSLFLSMIIQNFRHEINTEFKNNYSLEIKPKSSKIHKIKPNKNSKNAYILKYIEADISKAITEILDKIRIKYKETDKICASIFTKPVAEFLYWYLIKKAFLDGRRGLIFAKKKYIETLLLQITILEKGYKNDLW